MLELVTERQLVFYVVGIIVAMGIITKAIAGISIKRLVRAASNMAKSNHAFMRLVRAKFEHACMVSDKVQNVRAFVEKYLYEYRTLGIRLHTWRQMEKGYIWMCGFAAIVGAAMQYALSGIGPQIYPYGIVGGIGMALLFLIHILSDETYQIEAAKTYMVDFLENTYAHRYEKANQKEIQVTVQKAEQEEREPDDVEELRRDLEVEEVKESGRMQRRRLKREAEEAIKAEKAVSAERAAKSEKTARAGKAAVMQEAADELEPEIEKMERVIWHQPAKEQRMPEEEPEPMDMPKEARIREILEEFLA